MVCMHLDNLMGCLNDKYPTKTIKRSEPNKSQEMRKNNCLFAFLRVVRFT